MVCRAVVHGALCAVLLCGAVGHGAMGWGAMVCGAMVCWVVGCGVLLQFGLWCMGLWGVGLWVVGLWGHDMPGTVPFWAALLGPGGRAAVWVWVLWCGPVGCWGCAIRKRNTKEQKPFFGPLN